MPQISQEGNKCTTIKEKLRDYCPNIYTVIIGHAVNDSISTGGGPNSTEETPPGDFLANRMICFMAQGLSQDFHHVRYFLDCYSVTLFKP